MKIINKNELTLKLQQNPTPERNKFTSKCQTPKNDTQNFLKNLSNIQEANKTPKTLNKNKFIRLNFENTTNNLEKLN